LKKKGFKEESMTKVRLYALGTSTTLESNKSDTDKLSETCNQLNISLERLPFALGFLLCQHQTPRHFSTFKRGVGRVDVLQGVGTRQEFIEQQLARLIHLDQVQDVELWA
jgi:hypothetical protein